MRTLLTLSAGYLGLTLLSACDKLPSEPPVPRVAPVQVQPGTQPALPGQTSVPAAESVLTPGNEVPPANAAAGRSLGDLTRAQESNAMPMVGQNNDHSAPTAVTKPASAP